MTKEEFEKFEQISQAQFDYLVANKVICRTRKFKKPRVMRVNEETGQILYYDRYYGDINYCGYFKK